MTPSEIYAVAAGSALVLVLTFRLSASLVRPLHSSLFPLGARSVVLPYFLRRHRFLGPITYPQLVVSLLYLALNIFFNTFRIHDAHAASHRAAVLALVNLPLPFLASQLSFAADLVGIRIDKYSYVHRLASITVVAEACVHVILATIRRKSDIDTNTPSFYGIIVSR